MFGVNLRDIVEKVMLHNILYNNKRKYPLHEHVFKSIEESLSTLLIGCRRGSYYCRLCGRRGFTKRGMYLHLKRVHLSEITFIVEDEFRRRVYALRDIFTVKSRCKPIPIASF